MRKWRKCKKGMLRVVDFALGTSVVKLLSSHKYFYGMVYHVEDVKTGHQDFVGEEYCRRRVL